MRSDDWTTCLEALGRLTPVPLVLARPDGQVLAATPGARGRLGAGGSSSLEEAWLAARCGCPRVSVPADDGPCELALLDGARGDLRSAIHELRGVLNAIALQLDLLRGSLDQRGTARADAAVREVRRMAGLLDALRGEGAQGGGPLPGSGSASEGESQ
jgi:hypothetical protein